MIFLILLWTILIICNSIIFHGLRFLFTSYLFQMCQGALFVCDHMYVRLIDIPHIILFAILLVLFCVLVYFCVLILFWYRVWPLQDLIKQIQILVKFCFYLGQKILVLVQKHSTRGHSSLLEEFFFVFVLCRFWLNKWLIVWRWPRLLIGKILNLHRSLMLPFCFKFCLNRRIMGRLICSLVLFWIYLIQGLIPKVNKCLRLRLIGCFQVLMTATSNNLIPGIFLKLGFRLLLIIRLGLEWLKWTSGRMLGRFTNLGFSVKGTIFL